MLEAFTAIVGAMGVAGLGWLVAAVLAAKLWSLLREERVTEDALRAKLEELQRLHNESIVALQEKRIEDLKGINLRYDTTARAILSALKKLTRDPKDNP
jgi:uncharacterized membrane protein YccC